MYLLGVKPIGKLIKELGEDYTNVKIEYENGVDDYFYEKIKLHVGCIKYTIKCSENGACWEDTLEYTGIKLLDKIEFGNNKVDFDKEYVENKLRIREHNKYHEFIVICDVYKKSEYEDDFEALLAGKEEVKLREFNYSIGNDRFIASKIFDFMKDCNLPFDGRINGGKNKWLIL